MRRLTTKKILVLVITVAASILCVDYMLGVMDVPFNRVGLKRHESTSLLNYFTEITNSTRQVLPKDNFTYFFPAQEDLINQDQEEQQSFAFSDPDKAWQVTQKLRKMRLRKGCKSLDSKNLHIETLPDLLDNKNGNQLKNLLVDDIHKTIYCYIPKVACTEWKKITMVQIGKVTVENINNIENNRIHYYSGIKSLSSPEFKENIEDILKTYTKFLFVRHPLERLFSAYKNKFVENTTDARTFQKAYAINMMAFARNNSNVSQTGEGMTFQEFLFYLTSHNPKHFQEHWAPYVDLCFPCSIDYDFIGAYETLEVDSNQILRRIGAPRNLTFPSFRPSSTSKNLKAILQNIPVKLREGVFQTYMPDYTLFGYKKDPL